MDSKASNSKVNLGNLQKYMDIKLIRLLAIFSLITVSVTFFEISYREIITNGSYDWFDGFVKHFIVDWMVICFCMSIVAIITRVFFLHNIRTLYIFLFHFFFSITIGWLFSVMHSGVLFLLGKIDYEAFKYYSSFHMVLSYVSNAFLIYFGMTGIIYTYYYSNRLKRTELQRAVLSEQLTDTKMRVLKSQLQPHFLFNTLHNISSLIDSNTKQAQNMLNDLSDLLREVIVLREDHFNTLAKELYILQKYIDIISVRYSDHLTITTHVDPNIEDTPVPLMMIQPIVENAVKHGFNRNTEALQIVISIVDKEDQLHIEIKNNGTPISATLHELMGEGTGISNIMNRLDALYENNHTFRIENIDHWVMVRIEIPKYQKTTFQG